MTSIISSPLNTQRMTTQEYLISIAVMFSAIIAPALIVGYVAEQCIKISKRKNK